MDEELLITDLTRMQHNRVCVAGMLPSGEYLRPFPGRETPTETWLLQTRQRPIRPYAVLGIDLLAPRPNLVPPHVEDWDIVRAFSYHRDLTPAQRQAHLAAEAGPALADVFGAPVVRDEAGYACWVQSGTGERSLATVAVGSIFGVESRDRSGELGLRLRFRDASGVPYALPVTDLSCQMYAEWLIRCDEKSVAQTLSLIGASLKQATAVFLRVGIGRGYGRNPDRCFLQINGVHTFPDYLDGRCYADFIPAKPEFIPPF